MDWEKILDRYFELPLWVKYIIFSVLWIVLSILCYFLIISPQFTTIYKKQAHLKKLQRQARAIYKVTKQIKNFQLELKKLEHNFQIALKKLPDSKEIPSLLLNISEYGRKNNLDFLLFKPGKITKKEFYGVIPINIKLKGSFYDISRFLWEIGNMERIVRLPNVVFKPGKDNTIFLTGNLETYIFLKENMNAKKKKKKNKKNK